MKEKDTAAGLPEKRTQDSFWYVLNRKRQLKALFILWDELPWNRRRDLLALGRALAQRDKREAVQMRHTRQLA